MTRDVAPGAEVVSSWVQQAVAARASQGLALVVLGFCLGFLCGAAVPGTIAPAGVTEAARVFLAMLRRDALGVQHARGPGCFPGGVLEVQVSQLDRAAAVSWAQWPLSSVCVGQG